MRKKATTQDSPGRDTVAIVQAVATLEITSRLDAEKACRRGVRVASLRAGAEAARDTAVAAAGDLNKDRIERLSQEQAQIEAALEKWAKENREGEFAGKQELELAAGVLAFRAGNPEVQLIENAKLKIEDFKDVLNLMVRAGRALAKWRSWVSVKFELNRRKILSDFKANPERTGKQLKQLSLQVGQSETFSVEFRVKAIPGRQPK
jgi:hypothetical protein